MSLTVNHQTNDISNATGTILVNGVAVGGDNTKPYGSRGVFAGGDDPNGSNTIDYIDITYTGNATDFGDLSLQSSGLAGCSNGSRGVFNLGYVFGGSEGRSNVLEYITIASTGNATDFGDLTVARNVAGACSNTTRGVWGGGHFSTPQNVIDYITIATTGNATDFGDLLATAYGLAGCSDHSTRGVFGGGYNSDTIQYITIATAGNATDFGNLIQAKNNIGSCSSETRGLFAGGSLGTTSNITDEIDYITISTTGNATDFGNLLGSVRSITATSNGTRGVFASGNNGGGNSDFSNVIQYVTIASTGNATDFGDLTVAREAAGACSGT